MTVELRVVLIIVSILTTMLIMRKIRQSKLQIEDSVFWIGFSGLLILFSVFPQVPAILAGLAGTYTTANFIYMAVIFLLIVKLFHMTIKQSQMETKLKELVQQMALAEYESDAQSNKSRDGMDGGDSLDSKDAPDSRKNHQTEPEILIKDIRLMCEGKESSSQV